MSDEQYIKRFFHAQMGYNLDLDNPKTFNEKLQWLKLHDRKPKYSTMVDKFAVKQYLVSIIGEEYIIPTIGVWERFEDIDFNLLPEQFVLKCTHDSGGLVICRDKSSLDIDFTKKKLKKCLKHNFYWDGREWPYKNVKPRILAEQLMIDQSEMGLIDYKIHCFNGEPKVILVCKDRFSERGISEDFFDIYWNHLDVKRPGNRNAEKEITKPQTLDLMLKLAQTLSVGIPFLRVDYYSINDHVYVGELTFYPACGFQKFIPKSFDREMGDWIRLPEIL